MEISVGLAVVLAGGYALVACLMMGLWSHVPPRRTFEEVGYGVIWPLLLLLMVVAAFINSIVRAITDQDGYLAGIQKDTGWVRKQEMARRK